MYWANFGKSDLNALSGLHDHYPVLAHVVEEYATKGTRVTERELYALLDAKKSGEYFLISHAPFIPVDQKPGTLVEDEQDEHRVPTPYLDIIRYRRDGRGDNPNSLPNTLDRVAVQMSSQKLYYVIKINKADVATLREKLGKTRGQYKDLTTRALRYWMMDLRGGDTIISNQILRNQFPLAGEGGDGGADENILFLRKAQEIELSDS